MKLISIYIENFGCLHRYSLDLEEGLTVVSEANGFGKTTLAEFIRAMLYGFPRKAKSLDKNRRQKYTPWNGGKFGGNLVFETEGVRYRVERSFGATPKGDSFALIDLATGKKSDRFSEELGMELFQLDADSFERSTYLPQMTDERLLATDSILSKLSDLVEDTNDVGNFEKAMAALKSKRSTYVPYRGSGGSVMQAHGQISQLQEQLHRSQDVQAELLQTGQLIEQLTREQDSAKAQLEQVRQEIRRASEAAAVASVYRQRDQLEERHQAAMQERRKLEEKYPAGIPEPEQISQARTAAAQLEILGGRQVTEQEDLDAVAFLEENRARFEQSLPTEDALQTCRSRCEALTGLRRRILTLADAATRQPEIKANPLPLILLLILGIAGAVPATALLLRGDFLRGGVTAGIAAAAFVAAIFAGVRLSKARKTLLRFRQEQQQTRIEMDRLREESEDLKGKIESFLGTYGFAEGTDYYGRLAELTHSSEDYSRAKLRVAQWRQEKAAHEEQKAQWQAALDGFFANSGLQPESDLSGQLLQFRDDRKDWEEMLEQEKALLQTMEQFCRDHARELALPRPEQTADPQLLRRKEEMLTDGLKSVTEQLIGLQQNRERLDRQAQLIPQMQDDLAFWQEKKRADQKAADILDDTMALLEQAKENLAVGYMGPIREGFAEYMHRLWQDQEGQILITPELDVLLERFGEARELEYFSAGQTDTVMLCMRLALVDAMFRDARPFVILDDPFINLDDERTKAALQLLKNLSRDLQIIYLTCNSSRIPQ